MTKSDQRNEIRHQLSLMTAVQRVEDSRAICDHLSALSSIESAKTIFAYLPLKEEVDLCSLLTTWINEGRTVCVPVVSWKGRTMRAGLLQAINDASIIEGLYGLREPLNPQYVATDSIDVMLVPGIGFDRAGSRLGRGGGYYDRFLETARSPIVIGIGFDNQIVKYICKEKHDQSMTSVATPSGIIKM